MARAHECGTSACLMWDERENELEVFIFVFGDGVGWDFDWDAVAGSRPVRDCTILLRGRHQVRGDGADEALNAVPAGGIAVGMELLLPIAIVDKEGVILIAVAVIYPCVGNAHKFEYLQAGTGASKGSFYSVFLL